MALPDPREVERAVDEIRAKIQNTLSDETLPEQDRRDAVMRMTGEVSALEAQARELREHELEQFKAAAQTGSEIGAPSAHADQVAAFTNFVRTGDITNAALLTTPDANGGYIMPQPMREAIVDIVRKVNPIMENATVINLTKPGTFKVELPRKLTATAGGWVAETAARPATNAPTLGRQTLECFEWYAFPEATQSFLDSVSNAEQFLIDDIAATFAATLGTGLAVGTGSGSSQPDGVFTGTAFYTTKLSSTVDSVDAAQIIGSYFALPAKYLPTAKFYANGATVGALSALAWPNLGDTPLVSWNNGTPSIMGKEIVIVDDAPAIGNGAFPIAFGDMARAYAVGMHSDISTLRDPFTNKPYVGFYSTGRAGGTFWDPNALLLLKSDNA